MRLTGTDQEREFAAGVAQTAPGMAFIAGSGPSGMTCHKCSFWGRGDEPEYFAIGGNHAGEIKPARCAKYRQLTAGQDGPPVEHWERACKYFEANPSPPPFRKPR